MAHIQRIYVDTSVVGGCFDPEFAPWSLGLMKDFRLGHFRAVLSDVVATDDSAPAHTTCSADRKGRGSTLGAQWKWSYCWRRDYDGACNCSHTRNSTSASSAA